MMLMRNERKYYPITTPILYEQCVDRSDQSQLIRTNQKSSFGRRLGHKTSEKRGAVGTGRQRYDHGRRPGGGGRNVTVS